MNWLAFYPLTTQPTSQRFNANWHRYECPRSQSRSSIAEDIALCLMLQLKCHAFYPDFDYAPFFFRGSGISDGKYK